MHSFLNNDQFAFQQHLQMRNMPQGTAPLTQQEAYDLTKDSTWSDMQNHSSVSNRDSNGVQLDPQQDQRRMGSVVGYTTVTSNPVLDYRSPATGASFVASPPRQLPGYGKPPVYPAKTASAAPCPGYRMPPQGYLQGPPSQPLSSKNASVEILVGTICYTHSNAGNGRIFRCNVRGCNNISFKRMVDFERHYNQLHAPKPPQFWCPIPGCKRETPFPRKDKMEAHARTKHD